MRDRHLQNLSVAWTYWSNWNSLRASKGTHWLLHVGITDLGWLEHVRDSWTIFQILTEWNDSPQYR